MRQPPRWLFTVLCLGMLIACGIYLGIMHERGADIGLIVRAAGFGIGGLLMLWGAMGRGSSLGS